MEIDLNPNYNETISSKSHNLIRRLRDLICLLEKERAIGEVTIPSTSVSDILDRFFLWCGNLGVLHKPTNNLSLDRRLADASEVRDQIFVNIADFNEAIEDLARIVVGNSPNRNIPSGDDDAPDNHDGGSDADISPMDEAHMNLELMAEAMKSLFRLGVLVRKSGRRDRFQRALQQSSSTFDESFDIDYVSQKYPKLNNAKCQWLSKRLGSAGAKRRQFIKYCREHKGRLDIHDNELRDGATEKLSSKATTFVHNVGSRSLDSTFETRDEDDAISITTATTTFNAETKLKLPSLAELSPSGDHFECPICFTLQSFETENSWKIHAFRDLKAYVCTAGGTECNSLLFGDRNAWFEHELHNHRSHYNCSFCDRKGFRSKAFVVEHILSSHSSSPRDQLSALADASYVIPSQFRAQDCPFCDDWAAILKQKNDPKGKGIDVGATQNVFVSTMKFKRHVATHQEQLAIFVVPRFSDLDLDSDADETSSDMDPDKISTKNDDSAAGLTAMDDMLVLRRGDNESSVRDHPLYKIVYPQPDGLFHCPWEGQSSCVHKPAKLKANYDKFVDSHLKPYRCKIDSCENNRFSSTAGLLRHEREVHAMHGHGEKPYLCTYDGCERAIPGNGFPRQWNLKDHMRRVHGDFVYPENQTISEDIPAEQELKRKHDSFDIDAINRVDEIIGTSAAEEPQGEAADLKLETSSITGQDGDVSDTGDPADFVCEECGRQFDQAHKLNHHKRYHESKHECPYDECDKRFGTKTHLDRHIADRHIKSKAYHCIEPTCAYYKGRQAFRRKDNWRQHMAEKHGSTPNELEAIDEVIG